MGVSSVESTSKFTKNSHVEVTSEEEGFTAWFLAKIIDPCPKKRPLHVYVEYDTLLSENSTKPLKEFVNCSLVRPIPPQEPLNIRSFQVDDVVDAFYKDGWWPGVISNVFEGDSRFEVTFSNPPDLLVFGAADLRLHRDWIRGKWILPKKKQRLTELLFSKGKKVEVSLKKVEHSEVWFPAIVQEDTGNGSFLVEYQCLGKNGEPESVKVEVDSLHIRPSPPQLKGKNYDLLEKVDAYIEFGWWSGVINKTLSDNKYRVFFKETKKEREVNQLEIRPHMEWKEGNWFSTSQDVSTAVDYQGLAKNGSLNVHQTEERTVLKSLDRRMEWSSPSKEMEHSKDSDLPLLPNDHLNSSSVKALGEDIHLSSTSTNGGARTNNIEQSKVDLPSENLSRGKRARTKRHTVDELEHHAPQRVRRSAGRPPKSRINEPQALAGDTRVSELEHRTPEQLGRKSEVPPRGQMINSEIQGDKNDNGVKCTEENLVQKEVIRDTQAVLLDLSGGQQQVHDPPVEGIKEADQLDRHVETTVKRKRGRPPKLQKSPEVGQRKGGKELAKSPEVAEQNGGVAAGDMALGEIVFPVVVGLEATKVDGSVSNKDKIGVDKNIPNGSVDKKRKSSSKIEVSSAKKDKLRSRKGKQVSVGKQEKDSLKRGRTPNIDAASPNQDPDDTSAKQMTEVNGKGSLVNEAETSAARLPFIMSDDEPLSMWLEAPKTADASTSQGRNVEKQSITNCSQDIVLLSSQCNGQSLPFSKSCSLWNSIESMQVFRMLPQKPHFQSLFSIKENSREGQAIALMVDFAKVVEATSLLQPDCPRDTIEGTLETLLDLEGDGFKVDVVRDRLIQLLSAKDKCEDCVAKANEGVDQIEVEAQEELMIDNKVKDIENRIRLLQEEHALALSAKAEKKATIALLESRVNGLNDSIRNAEADFKAIAGAPWQVG